MGVDKKKVYGLGRFQVMALLQAARYYHVMKDVDKAKSFGLNRAIFYAWAKHYGGAKTYSLIRIENELRRQILRGSKPSKCPEDYVEVLGECVKISPNGFYMFGDMEQKPFDYDQQVTARIKKLLDPTKVWESALNYVSLFPESILKNPVYFYKYVYEPVRDVFFDKVINNEEIKPPKDLLDRLSSMEELVKRTRQKSLLDYSKPSGGDE